MIRIDMNLFILIFTLFLLNAVDSVWSWKYFSSTPCSFQACLGASISKKDFLLVIYFPCISLRSCALCLNSLNWRHKISISLLCVVRIPKTSPCFCTVECHYSVSVNKIALFRLYYMKMCHFLYPITFSSHLLLLTRNSNVTIKLSVFQCSLFK